MNESTCWKSGSSLRCPHCNNPLPPRDSDTGEMKCPYCDGMFRVTDDSAATTLAEVRSLGRFQLLERVGQGSFGAVWRARDTTLDRIVALKIPHRDVLESEELRERFLREAQAAAQLRHPSIVRVHEVLDLEGQAVLISEFIQGVSLKDFMEVQRVTFRQAACLIADVAEALDYAHSQGLIHRDVKPANILLELTPGPYTEDRLGKVVVVDFGLALREDAEVVLTIDGQLVGTPAYMSPEQAAGKGHQADRRSDVYGLGTILFQLLCGELPFRGARSMLLHQVLHEPPPPPRRLNDRIPRDLETICLKALAKEPGWRYPTAGLLAADLRRFLGGQPVHARPLGPLRRLWLWSRRNRPLAATTALASGALLALVILSTVFAIREHYNFVELAGEHKQSEINLRKSQISLTESQMARGLTLCEQNNVGHGELWLARALQTAPPDADDLRRSLRLNLAAWESGQCPLEGCLDQPERFYGVFFRHDGPGCLLVSRDGTCRYWDGGVDDPPAPLPVRVAKEVQSAALGTSVLVTAGRDGTIQRWALPGLAPLGPPLRLDKVRAVAVSDEATTLLASTNDGKAVLWHGQGDQFTAVELFRGEGDVAVALSADGRLAFTGGQDQTARLWDAATGKLLYTLPHEAKVGCGAFGPGGALLATGSDDGTVRLWDTATGKSRGDPFRHDHFIHSVAISPDGRFVLSGSEDHTARLWPLAAREPLAAPLWHARGVSSVAIAPDGTHVVTAAENSVRLWSLPRSDAVALQAPDLGWVRCAAFSPDGKLLLTGGGTLGKSGAGRLWDASTGKLLATPLVHKDLVLAAAFSPDQQTIATASYDGTIALADAFTGRAGPVLHQDGPVYVLSFNWDGSLLLTAGHESNAYIWDPQTGHQIGRLTGHRAAVTTAGFSPSQKLCFTGSEDGTLRLWRIGEQTPIATWTGSESILAAAFSPDGTRLVFACGQEARVLDTAGGTVLEPVWNHAGRIRSLAYHPGGGLVLVAGDDGTAQIWDVDNPNRQTLALTHTLPVLTAGFSGDGRLAVTGSADGTTRLWEVANGRAVGPAVHHRGRVSCAVFSPDGQHLVTGSTGQTAWLRQVPVPWPDEADASVRRVEVLTGMRLDESERLRILNAAEWRERANLLRK